MADLTLPATIPGLLRRGSPVLCPLPRVALPCLRGFVDGIDIDGDPVLILTRDYKPTWWAPSDLALDLGDPTGRAHAAWWLLGSTNAFSRPELHRGAVLWLATGWDQPARAKLWRTLLSNGRLADLLADLLAGMAMSDATLADGTPWVDAEALRRICLHLAGLPVEAPCSP